MPTIEFTTQELEFLRKKYEKELEEGLKHVEYLRGILSKIRPARREIKFVGEKRGPGRPRKIQGEALVPGIIVPEQREAKAVLATPKVKGKRGRPPKAVVATRKKIVVPGARGRGRPKKNVTLENTIIPAPETQAVIIEKSE